METQTLNITSTQVYLLKEPLAKTMAIARVVLNEEMQLTGLRVVRGANGLFVAYPNDPGYKGDDYRSLFYPVTRELRDHIESSVLGSYRSMVEENNITQISALLAASDAGLLSGVRGSKDFLFMMSKYNDIKSAEESVSKEIEESIKATAILRARLKSLKNTKVLPRILAAVHKKFDDKFVKLVDSTDKNERTVALGISKGVI